MIIFPAEYPGKVRFLTRFPVILRCLCKSFQNEPAERQTPPSSFSKLKSTGEPDSRHSELHQGWKNHWEFSRDLLPAVGKKLLPTATRHSSGNVPTGARPFLYHPDLGSTWTITFRHSEDSTSIKDNKFLPLHVGILPCPFKAHTPWVRGCFQRRSEGISTAQEMAGPALRAKEELFSFRKPPMGHYLLKKAQFLCSRAYNLHIKIGVNSPEQQ